MRLHNYRPLASLLTLLLLGVMLVGCVSVTPQTPAEAAASPAASPSARFPDNVAPPLEVPTASVDQPATTPEAGEQPAFVETEEPPASNALATIESLYENPLPRRDLVQLAYKFGRTGSLERVARTEPSDVEVGHTESFYITDVEEDRNYEISATLVLALEHVLVYVEDGVDVDLRALERSARDFNDRIYPRTRELFGSEWKPGVDGDPRLTILNARIRGAGGYFSGNDEVPRSVNRFSNEREMFYINIDDRPPGSDAYGDVLAHEFQHMIQWNEAERPETWFNEGMSQLAEELNGYEESAAGVGPAYLANTDVQLTAWAGTPQAALPHYGASYLFMTYFYEQYGKNLDLRQLIHDGAGERLELFAKLAREQNPNIEDFGDLYSDWAIANLINDTRYGDGRYAYTQLATMVRPEVLSSDTREDNVAQFGTDYWEIPVSQDERTLRFNGSEMIGIVAAEPEDEVMWWSNRGDNAHTSLTRSFDLRDVSSATLQFRLWFDIEEGYDNAFVSISTNGGETFTTLPGRHTTTNDPHGANWGHAYTSNSGTGSAPEWIDEEIDLTRYAGQEIVLRFSMITDDAFNRPGMVLDNIRIPEIDFLDDVETDAAGWTAQGFVRTDNRLPQHWEVRLIRIDGNTVTFEPLQLDSKNVGEYQLAAGQRGALVISATTPHTTERADYQVSITQP
jgi:immune inhibitor A